MHWMLWVAICGLAFFAGAVLNRVLVQAQLDELAESLDRANEVMSRLEAMKYAIKRGN